MARPCRSAQPSSATALPDVMSDFNPPSHTTTGPLLALAGRPRRHGDAAGAAHGLDEQHCRLIIVGHNRDAILRGPIHAEQNSTPQSMMPQAFASPPDHPPPLPLAGQTVLQIIPSLARCGRGGGGPRWTSPAPWSRPVPGPWWRVRERPDWSANSRRGGGIWIPFPADSKKPAGHRRGTSSRLARAAESASRTPRLWCTGPCSRAPDLGWALGASATDRHTLS